MMPRWVVWLLRLVVGDADVCEAWRPFPGSHARRDALYTGSILHVAVHLAYHIGQVDYHRRLVTGDTSGVDAISPVALEAFR